MTSLSEMLRGILGGERGKAEQTPEVKPERLIERLRKELAEAELYKRRMREDVKVLIQELRVQRRRWEAIFECQSEIDEKPFQYALDAMAEIDYAMKLVMHEGQEPDTKEPGESAANQIVTKPFRLYPFPGSGRVAPVYYKELSSDDPTPA